MGPRLEVKLQKMGMVLVITDVRVRVKVRLPQEWYGTLSLANKRRGEYN